MPVWGRADSTEDGSVGLQAEVPSHLVKQAANKVTGDKQLALAA